MINTNLDIIIIHMLNYFWVWVDLAETPQCQLLYTTEPDSGFYSNVQCKLVAWVSVHYTVYI